MRCFLVFIVLLATLLNASGQGVPFSFTTFGQAAKFARKEGKNLFVYVTNPSCGPCNWLENTTLRQGASGKAFSEDYACLRINAESQEGAELVQKYAVNELPTFLYFDSRGKLVHRVTGVRTTDQLVNDSRNAINPQTQLSQLAEKYNDGNRSPDLLYKYLFALADAHLGYEEVLAEYDKTQNANALIVPRNWELITRLVTNSNSTIFNQIIDNKEIFYKAIGEAVVDSFVLDVYMNNIYYLGLKNDSLRYQEVVKQLTGYNPKKVNRFVAEAAYHFERARMEPDQVYAAALAFYDFYEPSDPYDQIEAALYIADNFTDKPKLLKAAEWVKQTIDIDINSYNTAVYAQLLNKVGDVNGALDWARKSVQLAYSANEQPIKEAQLLIGKLENSVQEVK